MLVVLNLLYIIDMLLKEGNRIRIIRVNCHGSEKVTQLYKTT